MLTEAPRFPGRWLAAAAAAALLSGCHALYLASGQLAVNARRQPIAGLLQRSELDAALRARLEYASRAREFAVSALALADNGSYRSYVDLGRPFATWNVFAAPEFSVEPRLSCWPIVGCVAYRGYFDPRRARRAAARLARRGYDLHIAPSAAWSTLGHFRDPVLSTMLGYGDVPLAAMLFHGSRAVAGCRATTTSARPLRRSSRSSAALVNGGGCPASPRRGWLDGSGSSGRRSCCWRAARGSRVSMPAAARGPCAR